MLFHHHEALQLHARQLMRPKALQLFLKLLSVITSTSIVGFPLESKFVLREF
jgi:hypothetical protein